MKVLIVGCGYVGLALGEELSKQGHKVWGVRRRNSTGGELEAAGIVPVIADITDPASLHVLPARCEWVVNCTAAGGGGPEEYRRVYLEGTRTLIGWLAASPPKKFVYTSSTGVYSQNDGAMVDETSPVLPGSGTGQVLVETEQLLVEAAMKAGFPAVILRVGGIYGPDRGYWLKQYLAGTAKVEGTGGRRLNMIHRDDVAGALIAALKQGKPGEIYNAVDDEPPTQLEVFEWLSQRLGRGLPPSVIESPDALRRRGVTNKIVSNRKPRGELGWQLKYPTFREGYEAELRRTGLG